MEIAVGGERLYSHNLRDFLRIKEEDHQRNLNQTTSSSSGGGGRHNTTGLTLSAVLREKISQPPPAEAPPLQRVQSNRTLLDIIREDQITGLGRGQDDGRSSWQHLKDRIRLRRRGGAAAVWSSSLHIPSSDVPQNNNRRVNLNVDSSESTQPDVRGPSSLTRATSERFEQTSSLPTRRSITEFNNQHENHEEEAEERRGGDAVEAEAEGSQPARTSLMALLAENDRQNGYESSAYLMDEDEGDVEAETGGSGGDTAVKGGEYNSCCVCMVRHKGAAFIPCGHTFCRLCSRELWVQRGNCPLCNNYILEILDIF